MSQSPTPQSGVKDDVFGSGLVGPYGLGIKVAKVAPNMTAPFLNVPLTIPKKQAVRLAKPMASVSGMSITPGGLLSKLQVLDVELESNNRLVLFDSDGNKSIDSFFLSQVSFKARKPLLIAGLSMEGVRFQLKELSNHPMLLKTLGLAPGQWSGSLSFSGSQVTFPSIPALKVVADRSQGAAFNADYEIGTGDLSLSLTKATYSCHLFSLELSGSQFKLSNGSNLLSLQGRGKLTIPSLPLGSLSADVSLQFRERELDRLTTNLRWVNEGLKSLSVGGFSFTPLESDISLSFRRPSSSEAGRYVDLKNGRFQLGFAGQKVNFVGDICLSLDQQGRPQFNTASLKLESDVSIDLAGFKVKLLASEPNAPTKLSLFKKNGVWIPSLSGKIEFSDLSGLGLTVPDGGIVYGSKGWEFNDVKLGLAKDLTLGPIRFGPQSFARYQNGLLTVNPDLSVNLDSFNAALRPVGQLLSTVVTPVTEPLVKLFQTDIDLRSSPSIVRAFKTVKNRVGVDLGSVWDPLVGYLEAVPGNPYKDNKLTLGELLDFVSYQAFEFVRRNPGVANAAFKKVFKTDLPDWLLELPGGIDYASISLSATVARLASINQLAASLSQASSDQGAWVPLPFEVLLAAGRSKPTVNGSDSAKQALLGSLQQLSSDLRRLDQLSEAQIPAAIREVKALPLKVDARFAVPLYEKPVETLLTLIAKKPVDLVRTDFSLSSGVELNMGIPLAPLSATVPQLAPLTAALKATNARLDLRAGLGATLALSLGVNSSAPQLQAIGSSILDRTASIATLAKAFAGRDPITGQPLGLFVGQTPGKPMLQLTPSIQAGIGVGRYGIDALTYARSDGALNFTIKNKDGSNRVYLADAFKGLSTLPGLDISGSLYGEIGLNVGNTLDPTWLNPKVRFPIAENVNLV